MKEKEFSITHLTAVAIVAIVAGALLGYVYGYNRGYDQGIHLPGYSSGIDPSITNFEDCAAAGNPVMESYPRQCRTKDGRLFVEQVENPPTPLPPEPMPVEPNGGIGDGATAPPMFQ